MSDFTGAPYRARPAFENTCDRCRTAPYRAAPRRAAAIADHRRKMLR